MADTHLEYLQGQKTAYEMWESLRSGFERQSLATQNRIKRQIETFRKRQNENLTEHFLHFEQLIREYKSAGGQLSERECVLQLFQSLPMKEYQTVISTLETLSLADESLITLTVVKGRLLDEETKLKTLSNKFKEEVQSSAVFVANQGNTKTYHRQMNRKQGNVTGKGANQEKFPYKCYFCNKTEHKKAFNAAAYVDDVPEAYDDIEGRADEEYWK